MRCINISQSKANGLMLTDQKAERPTGLASAPAITSAAGLGKLAKVLNLANRQSLN